MNTMSRRQALILFARPPVEGRVKTRLSPVYSAMEARDLYEAMLSDQIERLGRAAPEIAHLSICWSEPWTAEGELAALIGAAPTGVQSGGDLGERMASAIQSALAGGFGRAAILGSDLPGLPIEYLKRAFDALDEAEVVLGPSDDGGYYLIGARRLHPELFQKIPWGTDRVLALTRKRLKERSVSHALLPSWYDVDTPADLVRLRHDLLGMRARGAPDLPRRTLDLLARLGPERRIDPVSGG